MIAVRGIPIQRNDRSTASTLPGGHAARSCPAARETIRACTVKVNGTRLVRSPNSRVLRPGLGDDIRTAVIDGSEAWAPSLSRTYVRSG